MQPHFLSWSFSIISSYYSYCRRYRKRINSLIIWPCNSDGSFSVKSCCTLIDNTSSATDRVFEANVWIKGAPPKVQVFLWLAVQDKVSTRAFLHQRTVCLPHKLHVFFAAQIWKPQSIFLYIVTFLGVFG